MLLDSPTATIPDPAALTAARRYAALQPFIVDKQPLFDAMMHRVGAAPEGTPGRIVELGVGTGGFLESIARAGIWPEAELIGADLVPGRIAVASDTMEALGREATLHAGINALDADGSFFSQVVPPASADVVVLAQFEHYAPNDDHSPLARRLTQAGQTWCTKAELRRLAFSRLRLGGWVFVIDDYAAHSPAEQVSWDRAWDAHVVREFAGEDARQVLDRIDGGRATALARHYDPTRPLAQRLALAARARARRRHRDCEEVQLFSAAWDDFRELFLDGQCGWMPHPDGAAHPQFF